MKNVQTPQFASDLYRDLADRRLLIPVIALAVALIAVPVLLSNGGSAAPAPASGPVVEGADAAAVSPAVLTENPGIRNYRERLRALKQKNPFAQKFALPTERSVALESGSGSAGAETQTSGLTAVEAAGLATGTESSVPASVSTDSGFSTDSGSSGSTATAPSSSAVPRGTGGQPKPELRFYAGRVDVRFGPPGDSTVYEDVRRLDFLPDEETPVVAFIGLTEGGNHAIFSLSSDVTETSGDGSCAPKKPHPCQFLNLRIGEERQLTYGPEGTTYRLKLVETHFVRVSDPRDK